MRVNYRKKPSTSKATSKNTRRGKTPTKKKSKELTAKEKRNAKVQKVAKALGSASTAESSQEAAADTFDATSSAMTSTRLRKQASTPGKAQAIIKRKRA